MVRTIRTSPRSSRKSRATDCIPASFRNITGLEYFQPLRHPSLLCKALPRCVFRSCSALKIHFQCFPFSQGHGMISCNMHFGQIELLKCNCFSSVPVRMLCIKWSEERIKQLVLEAFVFSHLRMCVHGCMRVASPSVLEHNSLPGSGVTFTEQ